MVSTVLSVLFGVNIMKLEDLKGESLIGDRKLHTQSGEKNAEKVTPKCLRGANLGFLCTKRDFEPHASMFSQLCQK